MKLAGLFCILITAFSYGQLPTPLNSIGIKNADYMTTDQFGQIYIIHFDQLKKIDVEGKEAFAFSNPLLGSITSVSALDPMNLLLFYRDQAQITTLDNRLVERTALKFSDYNLSDVQLISQSDESNIWAYDQATDRLYRLNKNQGTISNKSLNITQITGKENTPSQLESTYERVYLNIPEEGILVFDATGSLVRTLLMKGIRHFTLLKRDIIASTGYDIYRINLKTNKQTLLYTSEETILSMSASNERLYILTKKGLNVYPLK